MVSAGVALVVVGALGYLTSSAQVEAGAAPAAEQLPTPGATSVEATMSTTPETSSTTNAPSTTIGATTSAPPTSVVEPGLDARAVDEFVEAYTAAIGSRDETFLAERLHPTVVDGYGIELCRSWIEREILEFSNYQLTAAAEGPRDISFAMPDGRVVIPDTFTAPVTFVFGGQSFDAEASFAAIEGELYWLGQCR